MEDVNKAKKNNDSYNFLLLSLYFYLKKNNFNETSEKIFQECKLDSIFKLPHNLQKPKNEKERLTNQFIEYFYSNSFNNNTNFDLLGDFWNQFWRIFANKMNMGNNLNIETLYEKEEKNISKVSYTQKDISSNFVNKNLSSFNNNDNLKTINNLTNISKNTNNNINTEEMINIINTSNEHLNTNMNMNMNNNININNERKDKIIINNKSLNNNNDNMFYQNHNENNNNLIRDNSNMNKNIIEKLDKSNNNINKNHLYEEEEEEDEVENDIEEEMDEVNGIRFNDKNSSSIIKRANGDEMPIGIYSNEHDNEMGKNIYPGFQPNNSSSNFNLNLTGQNIKIERNMSAIPLRKDVNYENINQDFEI
jgi:hypothetical protein